MQALSLMWPELLEPIDGAVTPSSVRFRMTLRAGNGEAVVSVDDIARMDMKHLHATMFTHLRELHFLIHSCAGAGCKRCHCAQETRVLQGHVACSCCISAVMLRCLGIAHAAWLVNKRRVAHVLQSCSASTCLVVQDAGPI